MKKYGYRVVLAASTFLTADDGKRLNELGMKGWRVIHIQATGNTVMEREITEPQPQKAPNGDPNADNQG